jgi:hypothetical protein
MANHQDTKVMAYYQKYELIEYTLCVQGSVPMNL